MCVLQCEAVELFHLRYMSKVSISKNLLGGCHIGLDVHPLTPLCSFLVVRFLSIPLHPGGFTVTLFSQQKHLAHLGQIFLFEIKHTSLALSTNTNQ